MKKLSSLICLFIIVTSSKAQTAFDKFVANDKMTTVLVNKKMFEMMGRIKMDKSDKETQKFMQVIQNLDALRVFVTADPKLVTDLKSAAVKHQKSLNLEELTSINEGGKRINIQVKSGENPGEIKELLLIIEDGKNTEMVVLSLTGSFNIEDLSLLSDKMDLPGKNYIKNATKKSK